MFSTGPGKLKLLFPVENTIKNALRQSSQRPQSGFFGIFDQLDSSHPLIALGHAFDWSALEQAFAPLYTHRGRAAQMGNWLPRIFDGSHAVFSRTAEFTLI